MKQRIGTYITQKVPGESFKAYIPKELPPKPAIELKKLSSLLEKAAMSLANLNSIAKSVPNTSLFIYMYVRKEALLSSQIEGTQSSFSDLILFEHQQKSNIAIDDVEEVSNYVKAINYGIGRLKNGFPLSLRLLREIHGLLLKGSRGAKQLPGEFRKSQNWIGGTRPGNALFVPPPKEYLPECLANLEKFLHTDNLPTLIKVAIAHVQFETIHPFLDGNGRVGRLLIILMLIEGGLMDEPILYISLYLKQNRNIYYELLQEVRNYGTFETWIEFFLNSVIISSKQAINTAKSINNLFEEDIAKINSLKRARFSCLEIFEHLKQLPQITASNIGAELNISLPTIRNSLSHLVDLNILEEITGKQRDRVYVYRNYLNLLEKDTKPL